MQDTKDNLKDGRPKVNWWLIDSIDSATLEIYLIHMIVLKVIMIEVLGEYDAEIGVGVICVAAITVMVVSILLSVFTCRTFQVIVDSMILSHYHD